MPAMSVISECSYCGIGSDLSTCNTCNAEQLQHLLLGDSGSLTCFVSSRNRYRCRGTSPARPSSHHHPSTMDIQHDLGSFSKFCSNFKLINTFDQNQSHPPTDSSLGSNSNYNLSQHRRSSHKRLSRRLSSVSCLPFRSHSQLIILIAFTLVFCTVFRIAGMSSFLTNIFFLSFKLSCVVF